MLYSFLFFHSKPLTNHGIFPSFSFVIDIFPIFASALTTFGGFKQNILTKAFSGRFGFDLLELRDFQTDCQKQSNGNAPCDVYIHLLYTHLAWGFQRCSFRQSGQCEGLNRWNGHQNWLHVFISVVFG